MASCVKILVVALLATSTTGSPAKENCPCHQESANPDMPGGEEGNIKWNCRDRLLPEVPRVCWEINPAATQVDLFNHHLETLKLGDFDALFNLKWLNVYKGWLKGVEDGALRPVADTLEHLDIGFGNLTEVPREVSYLKNLKVLGLEYNKLREVNREYIEPLKDTLAQLMLVRNQLESIIPVDFLPHLTWLDLEANNLRSLPLDLLAPESPCLLWINDNPISDVAAGTLLPLPDGSEIRTNASVVVWTRNDEEAAQLARKEWRVYDKMLQVLDLAVMTQSCDEGYDKPVDFIHPCEA